MRPQSHPKPTPRLPQSQVEARGKPSRSQRAAREQGGIEYRASCPADGFVHMFHNFNGVTLQFATGMRIIGVSSAWKGGRLLPFGPSPNLRRKPKDRTGEFQELAGVSAPHEPTAKLEIELTTPHLTVREGVSRVIACLAALEKERLASTFGPGHRVCPQQAQAPVEEARAAMQALAGVRGPEPAARL